ncbi:hypothetical protein [Caballeronia sp. SL2Y3]|uniref:hypothetical protein n=1 Tax=Caballeronia sp. SL2Y3 TaxID=2878151 RepID=UPI001FCFDA6E|nr:hypothetical protein [Caballeronia sp. SL2Y3]
MKRVSLVVISCLVLFATAFAAEPQTDATITRDANPERLKRVKKGDQVKAVYTEALAISVEPAAKK